MTYKLLSNGRGVPIALTTVKGSILELEFQNAPTGANAYIKQKNGAVFYRTLLNGKCQLDLSRIAGEVELGVMTTDAQNKPYRWNCGGLTIMHTLNGIMVAPSAADLVELVNGVMLECEEMRQKYAEINGKMAEIEKRFGEFFEGYDII